MSLHRFMRRSGTEGKPPRVFCGCNKPSLLPNAACFGGMITMGADWKCRGSVGFTADLALPSGTSVMKSIAPFDVDLPRIVPVEASKREAAIKHDSLIGDI